MTIATLRLGSMATLDILPVGYQFQVTGVDTATVAAAVVNLLIIRNSALLPFPDVSVPVAYLTVVVEATIAVLILESLPLPTASSTIHQIGLMETLTYC
jgi:hypothetical protein